MKEKEGADRGMGETDRRAGGNSAQGDIWVGLTKLPGESQRGGRGWGLRCLPFLLPDPNAKFINLPYLSLPAWQNPARMERSLKKKEEGGIIRPCPFN